MMVLSGVSTNRLEQIGTIWFRQIGKRIFEEEASINNRATETGRGLGVRNLLCKREFLRLVCAEDPAAAGES